LAAILLDENVSARLVPLLRRRGHECISATEIGFSRAKDPGLLLWSATAEHIVVTHDEDDFAMLHRAWRLWSTAWNVDAVHAGIIAVPQSPAWPYDRTAQEIDQLVRERGQLTNQFFKYRLPDGWLIEA
jgi:hypothetical protein